MKKSPIENLERIAIAASVIGTIISALSSQAVYAAMPITFSLFLNLVNRNDVKKQIQSNVNISQVSTKNDILSKVGRKIDKIPDLTDRVENLADTLKDLSSKQGNFQHQTQNNFDSLTSNIEEIPNLTDSVKNLTEKSKDLSIKQGNFQQQIQNNFGSLTSKIEKIPDLTDHVKNLNDSLNNLSSRQGNFQQQTQNNFGSLNSKTEEILGLTEQVESLNEKLNDISIKQGNFQQQTQNNFGSLNSRIEEIPDLIEKNVGMKFSQVNRMLNRIKRCNYELIYDRSRSREKLFEALDKVQNRLVLVCPWISQSAIDTDFEHKIKQALDRKKVKIYIGCGNRRDIDKLAQGSQSNPIDILDMLVQQYTWQYSGIPILRDLERDYPDQIYLKVLGTHEKFLVCDNSWAVITSHNFLASGSAKKEREVGLLTYDKNIISSLIKRHNENTL